MHYYVYILIYYCKLINDELINLVSRWFISKHYHEDSAMGHELGYRCVERLLVPLQAQPPDTFYQIDFN
jgi:hypothetical protein